MLPILTFLAQYIHIIGWPSLMYAAYRVGRFFTKIESRFIALEENINKAMTNDLPHLQISMTAILEGLTDLRDDIRYLTQGFLHR